jgi:hypothetical protein
MYAEMIQAVCGRVAASSAAWGWLFPTIPKAFGFEAATRIKNSNLLIQTWYTDDLGDTK